jgi:hypothetical protein
VINIARYLLIDSGGADLGPCVAGVFASPGVVGESGQYLLTKATRVPDWTRTSPIVRIWYGSRVVETRSGSMYRLYQPSPSYLAWVSSPQGAHHRRFAPLWERGPAAVEWIFKNRK